MLNAVQEAAGESEKNMRRLTKAEMEVVFGGKVFPQRPTLPPPPEPSFPPDLPPNPFLIPAQ